VAVQHDQPSCRDRHLAAAALVGVVAAAPTVWSPLNVRGFIPAI
jgi:hypothetical protein